MSGPPHTVKCALGEWTYCTNYPRDHKGKEHVFKFKPREKCKTLPEVVITMRVRDPTLTKSMTVEEFSASAFFTQHASPGSSLFPLHESFLWDCLCAFGFAMEDKESDERKGGKRKLTFRDYTFTCAVFAGLSSVYPYAFAPLSRSFMAHAPEQFQHPELMVD